MNSEAEFCGFGDKQTRSEQTRMAFRDAHKYVILGFVTRGDSYATYVVHNTSHAISVAQMKLAHLHFIFSMETIKQIRNQA